MAHDVNFPANDSFLADFPAGMREEIRAIVNDAIVNALKLNGLTAGNGAGQIPINNGVLNTDLNAERVGGKLPSAFAPAGYMPPVATGSSTGAMSNTDKNKLDGIAAGAQVNQMAFSNVLVGSTTIQADSPTDTLEVVAGANIALTPDATNDRLTIGLSGKVPSATDADTAANCTGNAATATSFADGKKTSDFAKTAMAYTATQGNNVNLEAGIYSVENSAILGIPGKYTHIFSGKYSVGGFGAQLMIPYENGTYDGVYYRVATGSTYGAPKRLIEEGDTRLTDARPANGGTSSYASYATRLRSLGRSDNFFVSPAWEGNYWWLRGFSPDDTYHGPCAVNYADKAGSVPWSGITGAPTIPIGNTGNIFVSDLLDIPVSTSVEVSHGFGVTPLFFIAYIQCVIAQYGYAVGDRVAVLNNYGSNAIAANNGYVNSTKIGITVPAGLVVPRRDTSGLPSITLANWRVVLVAIKTIA